MTDLVLFKFSQTFRLFFRLLLGSLDLRPLCLQSPFNLGLHLLFGNACGFLPGLFYTLQLHVCPREFHLEYGCADIRVIVILLRLGRLRQRGRRYRSYLRLTGGLRIIQQTSIQVTGLETLFQQQEDPCRTPASGIAVNDIVFIVFQFVHLHTQHIQGYVEAALDTGFLMFILVADIEPDSCT